MLGGLAQNEGLLLGARGLQGLGAALASPAALALITTTFPAGPQRNRAFAVYAAMSGAGAAVGLILGGWLTGLDGIAGWDFSGWRLTFLINVPIGLAAAFIAPRLLAESESHRGELDIPGALTGTLGLLGIVFGLTQAGKADYGWDHPSSYVSLIVGLALLGLFAFIESRVEHPLLPMRILKNRTRAASFIAMMLAPAAMFAMFFFLSLFIQQIVGYSPLSAGFAFLPFSFGIVIGAGLASNLVSRIDPRYLAGFGTLMASFSLFMFSRLSIDDSPGAVVSALAHGSTAGTDVNYWTSILPWVVTMSIGMGLTFVPLTLTAVHHVKAADSGIGSGVLNTMQQVGGALGLATLSTVSLHYVNNSVADMGPGLAKAAAGSPHRPEHADPGLAADLHRGRRLPGVVHRRGHRRVPGGLRDDARRVTRGVDLPERQARGTGHGRPGRRPAGRVSHDVRRGPGQRELAGPSAAFSPSPRAARRRRSHPGWSRGATTGPRGPRPCRPRRSGGPGPGGRR